MILEDRTDFNWVNPSKNRNDVINTPDERFIQVINGVRVTLGCNPHNYFNLSLLGKQRPYQTDARGYYNKSKQVFDPLDWIKSDIGNKYIANIPGKIEDEIFASSCQYDNKPTVTIYTRNFYLWLEYLKHCIGDIDTAIKAELHY